MSGSVRSITTTMLHRGHRYAPTPRTSPGANPNGWRALWWTQG